MIKLGFRRNSIYIIQYFIYYYVRRIIKLSISQIFEFNDSIIFSLIMHLGEFFGGLFSFLYQNTFIKQSREPIKLSGIKLIGNKKKMNRADKLYKIGLLIFFAAFFDFTEYLLINYYIPRISATRMSPTYDLRFNSITTISSSLIFTYALRLKTGRHQFYSLLITGICLALVVIIELIYNINILNSFVSLLFAYLLTIMALSLMSFTDTIEKYLYEFNFLNPLLILLLESIFGLIFVSIFSIINSPFEEITKKYNKLKGGEFVFLIILLFFYLIFSSLVNIFKVLSNIFYSPMAKSVSSYVLNPIMIIYSFFFQNDFISNGEQNITYFIINIILSIIIVFFGCVYNEFFVLHCFGLDYETHKEIATRAGSQDLEFNELSGINENDDDEDDF